MFYYTVLYAISFHDEWYYNGIQSYYVRYGLMNTGNYEIYIHIPNGMSVITDGFTLVLF